MPVIDFLTNKGFVPDSNISLVMKNKIITDEKELAETFNEHYIKKDLIITQLRFFV